MKILTDVGGGSAVGSKDMRGVINEPRFQVQATGSVVGPLPRRKSRSGGVVTKSALGIPNIGVQDISNGQLVLHSEAVAAEWASPALSLD